MTATLFALQSLLSAASYATSTPPGLPEIFRASVINEDKKQVFTLDRTLNTTKTASTITSTYKDADGQDLIHEIANFEGTTLKRVEIQRVQEGESGFVEIRDAGQNHEKVLFFSWTEGSKTKTDTEEFTENFVTGPTMETYLRSHWGDILNDQTVKFRMAALNRRMTVGFEMKKVASTNENGRELIELRLKPTSPFIAILVPRLTFWFEKSTARLMAYEGRLFPRLKSGNHWKEIDGKILYSYPSQSAFKH